MDKLNRSSNKAIFALVALAVLARVVLYLATNYQVDDALITFRYAENIATGNGFVYNIGERVCGTTTPLFTILLAGFAVLGISVSYAAISISIISAVITTFLLVRFAQECGAGPVAYLPAILYSLYPRSLISDISGLETALFTMLVVLTLLQVFRKHHQSAAITAGIASLTRPEGVGLIAIVICVALWDRAPRIWQILATPFLLLSGWVTFAYSYFGSAIPNSLSAKSALYQEAGTGVLSRVGELMTLGPISGVIAFGILLCVTVWLVMKLDRTALVALTGVGLISGLAVFSPRIFYWYAAPALPLIFLVFARSFAVVSKNFRLPGIAVGFSIAALIGLGVVSYGRISDLRSEMDWYSANHIAAAKHLALNAGVNDTVLAEDIGHFGYHYRGAVVDLDGLVSPQVIAYNRNGEQLRFADSIQADWIFIAKDYPASQTILNSQLLREHYAPVDYDNTTVAMTHLLYRLRD